MLNNILAVCIAAAVVVVIAVILGAVELVRKAVATICRRWATRGFATEKESESVAASTWAMAGDTVTFCLSARVYAIIAPAEENIRVLLEDPRRDLGVGALPAGRFTARSDEYLASGRQRCYCLPAKRDSSADARHVQRLRKADCVPITPRCLTCKAELPAGVAGYCNEVCFLKAGRTKRSPGRTAAHRRRRRGGRKL
jgi:hypothetical protein